ncbi:hypothetical protein K474DRAFT_958476 [Panus rudis PR-1116 ss-1]|nr:hypothetical protein K474DRAFT_958476 [Panus rudis PR-1116 ss-1]
MMRALGRGGVDVVYALAGLDGGVGSEEGVGCSTRSGGGRCSRGGGILCFGRVGPRLVEETDVVARMPANGGGKGGTRGSRVGGGCGREGPGGRCDGARECAGEEAHGRRRRGR